jgi:long-chain acyl-CoA synthetase
MSELTKIDLPFRSIPQMLRENARQHSDRAAISYKKEGNFISLSYAQFYTRILMAARGLRKAGIQPGERVAIFSENRAGWAISDLGIQAARGISVPIYATNTANQAAYVINHCAAKIVFVSSRLQYEKLLAVREQIPQVELVVSYERFLGDRKLPVYTLFQLSEISHPITEEEKSRIEADIDAVIPEDLATIIYTSGTTGDPKGVMLTQYNLLFDAWYGLKHLGGTDFKETFLSFLPLSHVLERTAGYTAALMTGSHIAFAESVEKVVENIAEIRPTAMVSVPRLFEKIYSRIYENVHHSSALKRKLFHRAVEVGREYVDKRYIRKQPVGLLGTRYRFYDKLVFSKIRAKFGGRLRFFISGGAPLDKSINEFMWIIGIPVFEGYGLTETSPAISLNNRDQVRFGSVGTLLPFTEVKLAGDGELLIRGPQLMQGYYRNEQSTAETMEDGWLKTGDIARIDAEGFVYIVDRKKELIVTAGGKNIAPQPLENELKLDKYISQAFVFGDAKPYLVALLTPNLERLIELAQQENINYLAAEELVANQRVQQLYTERIAQFNKRQPTYQTIKKFVLLPREFSIEGGELTPTLKLKRKAICALYKDRIEQLYLANGGDK